MKSIRNIAITAVVFISMLSCSDFWNKEPHLLTDETYFNNETELKTFLTGVYSPIMQEHFYGNYYPLYNAGGDDLTFYQRSTPTVSIICANASSTNEYITKFWRILYDGINRANILLENVDRNDDISQSYRDKVRAEALFLRSFYYFNLVQGWGDVPMRLESVKEAFGLNLARTDKQIIYDQIIEDIKTAIPYLPQSNEVTSGYITQSAAKGILARIYLFRAGEHYRDKTTAGPEVETYFRAARDWAKEVKDSNLHGLVTPYSRIFLDYSEDKYNSTGIIESIWEAEEAGNRSTAEQSAGRIGNVIGFGSKNDYSTSTTYKDLNGMKNPGYSYRFAYNSLKMYEMYDSEGDTARGDWSIAPYEYKYASTGEQEVTGREYYYGKLPAGLTEVDGMPCTELNEVSSNANKTRCVAKYRREHEVVTPKNKNYTPINFPILRYSDVLLMIAEADNEINGGPTDLAYECIDAVRERAHLAPLRGTGLSRDTFREAIKKERAMELCYEAIRRWDLIRWGDYYRTMLEMQGNVQQEGWSAGLKYAVDYYKISEAYNYYPIPEAEMSVNKLITQNNPGW